MSYSRHDEALVKPLAGLLGVAAEDAVFLDIEQLKPGDLWENKIIGAVEESAVFVLCWCCQSKKSTFVAKEIRIALADSKKKLVPVLFCATELPSELANRQWIDLRGRVVHVCEHAPAKEEPKKRRSTRQSTQGNSSSTSSSTGHSSGWADSIASHREAARAHYEAARTSQERARASSMSEMMQEQQHMHHERSHRHTAPSRLPKLVAFFLITFVYYGVFVHKGSVWHRLQSIGMNVLWLFAALSAFKGVMRLLHWLGRRTMSSSLRDEAQADAVANRARSYFEGLHKS